MKFPNMTWTITDESPTYEKRLQVLEVGTVGCSRQLLERVAVAYEGSMVATLLFNGIPQGETLVDQPESSDVDTLIMISTLSPTIEEAMTLEATS